MVELYQKYHGSTICFWVWFKHSPPGDCPHLRFDLVDRCARYKFLLFIHSLVGYCDYQLIIAPHLCLANVVKISPHSVALCPVNGSLNSVHAVGVYNTV